MIEKYIEILKNLNLKMGLNVGLSAAIAETIAALTLIVLSICIFFLIKYILKRTVYKIIQLSTNKYDDLLLKNKVIGRMCLLIPALITGMLIDNVLPDFPETAALLMKLVNIFEIFICTMIISSFVSTGEDLYNMHEMSKIKPITGLIQVTKIVLYILCVLIAIAFVLGTKIGNIIGDWISIGPADGNVLEINLTTVKVQNWDNTITTIPTYNLVSNPFTNWRGMSESGGRRIARTINIDVNTIRYCTPEMIEKYKRYGLVKDYIEQKEEDILEYNKANRIDTSEIINGRQQTNLGIFRAYIKAYLNNNPKLNHNLTMMVRQMQPTEFGVPLQIYAFSSDKKWINYEEIQSDIFDHVISAATMFDLKIYQKH